jgi:hypothetical protein
MALGASYFALFHYGSCFASLATEVTVRLPFEVKGIEVMHKSILSNLPFNLELTIHCIDGRRPLLYS